MPEKRPLEGKVALVTGGSRGIGRAIVERLAADGASVVFSYVRDVTAAETIEAVAESAGCSVSAVQADVADELQVDRLYGTAMNRFGRLDIVVNNAAITLTPPRPIAEMNLADLDAVLAVNLRGAFHVLHRAARQIADGGRIVAISSSLTRHVVPGTAAYVCTKAALEAMVRILATELGYRQVTVNAIAPGVTDTDMMREVIAPEERDAVARFSTLGRIGQPGDIAAAVAFLCGPGGWFTGQTLYCDGSA